MREPEQVRGMERLGVLLVEELVILKGIQTEGRREGEGDRWGVGEDADLGLAVAVTQKPVDVEFRGFFLELREQRRGSRGKGGSCGWGGVPRKRRCVGRDGVMWKRRCCGRDGSDRRGTSDR